MYRICSQCHSLNDQPERCICSTCEHNILTELAERNELRLYPSSGDPEDDFGLLAWDEQEQAQIELGSEEVEGDSPLWI